MYKFVINDRAAQFKRLSTEKIQTKLISGDNVGNNQLSIIIKKSDLLKKNLPDNYIYFHAKRKILNELGWGNNELKMLFDNGYRAKYMTSIREKNSTFHKLGYKPMKTIRTSVNNIQGIYHNIPNKDAELLICEKFGVRDVFLEVA